MPERPSLSQPQYRIVVERNLPAWCASHPSRFSWWGQTCGVRSRSGRWRGGNALVIPLGVYDQRLPVIPRS